MAWQSRALRDEVGDMFENLAGVFDGRNGHSDGDVVTSDGYGFHVFDPAAVVEARRTYRSTPKGKLAERRYESSPGRLARKAERERERRARKARERRAA